MDTFIHIRSRKFPALPGEQEEMVNPGTYGMALANYLKDQLTARGYRVPFVCCEDWGWWVELRGVPFAFGVCIYAGPEEDGPMEYLCTDGATAARQWSWKKFRFVETAPWVEKLHQDLLSIFQADEEVEVAGVVEDIPW